MEENLIGMYEMRLKGGSLGPDVAEIDISSNIV